MSRCLDDTPTMETDLTVVLINTLVMSLRKCFIINTQKFDPIILFSRNMVPVPFIILYLKKLATFLSQRSASATQIMDLLFERARRKAAPVEEFQWLGLMLFVAVPFPGTGAWTGAIISSVLGMPFWSGFSANFVGVVLAGLLVNLLMNLGLNYAIITGLVLFFVSTVMWGALRSLKKSLNAK
ncbi:hypothetical protein ABZP36_019038 [Zizania latifolia]